MVTFLRELRNKAMKIILVYLILEKARKLYKGKY